MDFKARISVFGGRQVTNKTYENALELGRLLGKDGYLVYNGGGSGVMEAVSKGVDQSGGICVGILKGSSLNEMNPYVHIPLATNLGITRNALLAYNCDVAVAISGQYGTLSEISYVLQLKKPIVGFKSWDIGNMYNVKTIKGIMQYIERNI